MCRGQTATPGRKKVPDGAVRAFAPEAARPPQTGGEDAPQRQFCRQQLKAYGL